MTEMKCEYKVSPIAAAPDCSGSVIYYVPNYFKRILPGHTDKHIHLCKAHAEFWNAIHPFHPRAILLRGYENDR